MPVMTETRKAVFHMTLLIIVPITLIVVTFVGLYARHQFQSNLKEVRANCIIATLAEADNIRSEMSAIVVDVQMIASLLSNPEVFASDMINEYVKIHDEFRGITIAYDPNFLKAKREGKYPIYNLENHFEFLSNGDIPEQYAPTLVRDDDGKLLFANNKLHNYWMYDWYLLAAIQEKGVWTDPFVSVTTGDEWIGYSVPLYYGDAFIGVVCVTFDAADFFKGAQHVAGKPFKESRMFLLAETGKILYHSDERRWRKDALYSAVDQSQKETIFPLIDKLLSGDTGMFLMPNWGKGFSVGEEPVDTWFIYTPVQAGAGLTLVVTFREKDVITSIYQNVTLLYAVAAMMIVLLSVVTTAIVFRIYNPILAMTDIVRKVTKGNYDVHLPERFTKRKTVIGEHAKAFDIMARSLREALKQATEEKLLRVSIERELEVARQIQTSLLPAAKLPLIKDNFFLDAFLVPAKFVAGDFFDFWRLDNDNIAFLVADVSGKGVPAALVMVEIRTLIRQLSDPNKSPGAILTDVNAIVQPANRRFMFTTLVFAFYNMRTGLLRYCNAGHTAPALMRSDGSVIWFEDAENPVLGVLPGAVFSTSEFQMAVKDAFFLYTDGVPDSRAEGGEPFGDDRLNAMVSKIAKEPVEDRISEMVHILNNYCKGDQKDDITMLIIKRR